MQRLVSRAAVRCILVFLSVFVLQVPRGVLIICYPTSPALDFISPVLGQLYYMIYVLSIIRIIRSTPQDRNVDMDDRISPSPGSVALSSIHFVLPNDIPDSELMESVNLEGRADTATPGNSSINLIPIRTPTISVSRALQKPTSDTVL
ncbi:uncharacterized protein EI90DRAFT_3065614 [Cantharellus anzutake]|uniref:uncharacterized protein n=1 Tax=Cantharellus anzutake TaxID=1750568 RepID=UPI0019059D94|nr:uncharacterized protein EI90DRAFT_3065614 [Cantharellus anzutake]KAF8328104.1 hypothetical protein EI90DRAFT_3065614 [Cantharellus anzutake]